MFYQMLQLDCHYLTKHAQVFMKELGITYKHAVPQSIADCWQFWCCEVPDYIELPEQLEIREVNPIDFVGYGLSDEKAMELADILGYNYQIEDGCLVGGLKQSEQTRVIKASNIDLSESYHIKDISVYMLGREIKGYTGGLIKIEKDETKC